jgi:hypothetical protein
MNRNSLLKLSLHIILLYIGISCKKDEEVKIHLTQLDSLKTYKYRHLEKKWYLYHIIFIDTLNRHLKYPDTIGYKCNYISFNKDTLFQRFVKLNSKCQIEGIGNCNNNTCEDSIYYAKYYYNPKSDSNFFQLDMGIPDSRPIYNINYFYTKEDSILYVTKRSINSETNNNKGYVYVYY